MNHEKRLEHFFLDVEICNICINNLKSLKIQVLSNQNIMLFISIWNISELIFGFAICEKYIIYFIYFNLLELVFS